MSRIQNTDGASELAVGLKHAKSLAAGLQKIRNVVLNFYGDIVGAGENTTGHKKKRPGVSVKVTKMEVFLKSGELVGAKDF